MRVLRVQRDLLTACLSYLIETKWESETGNKYENVPVNKVLTYVFCSTRDVFIAIFAKLILRIFFSTYVYSFDKDDKLLVYSNVTSFQTRTAHCYALRYAELRGTIMFCTSFFKTFPANHTRTCWIIVFGIRWQNVYETR